VAQLAYPKGGQCVASVTQLAYYLPPHSLPQPVVEPIRHHDGVQSSNCPFSRPRGDSSARPHPRCSAHPFCPGIQARDRTLAVRHTLSAPFCSPPVEARIGALRALHFQRHACSAAVPLHHLKLPQVFSCVFVLLRTRT
jgi:hypothetical protein